MNEYDGSTPLPPSDLTSHISADDMAEGECATKESGDDTPPQDVIRRRWATSPDFMSVTLTDPPAKPGEAARVSVFNLADIPPLAYAHLAYIGATIICGRADDAVAEFERVKSGKAHERKEKSVKSDPWRQALALAFVEATKKAAEPLTLEQATKRSLGASKDDMKLAKTDPIVVKHWRKLTGAVSSVASMLEVKAAA